MPRSPLYKRFKERLCADLAAAQPVDGLLRIPPERALQLEYGVSRPTIRRALGELVAEGLAVRSPGSASFLLPRARQRPRANGAVRRIGYVALFPGYELNHRCLTGIERAAQKRGYRILISNAGRSMAEERVAADDLIGTGARGLLVTPIPREVDEIAGDYLRQPDLGVPVVLIDTCLPIHPHPRVIFDNRSAAEVLTRRLLSAGHTRIAYLTFLEQWVHPTLGPRLEGYRAALAEAGISVDPELVRRFHPDSPHHEVSWLLDDLLDLRDRPTAIIAAEDRYAVEVIQQLRERGMRVPEDITVVGWDNLEMARHFQPAFPTTFPDFERLGEAACEMLIGRIENEADQPAELVFNVPLAMDRAELLPARGQRAGILAAQG